MIVDSFNIWSWTYHWRTSKTCISVHSLFWLVSMQIQFTSQGWFYHRTLLLVLSNSNVSSNYLLSTFHILIHYDISNLFWYTNSLNHFENVDILNYLIFHEIDVFFLYFEVQSFSSFRKALFFVISFNAALICSSAASSSALLQFWRLMKHNAPRIQSRTNTRVSRAQICIDMHVVQAISKSLNLIITCFYLNYFIFLQ